MTTQAEIKRVIDLLERVELQYLCDTGTVEAAITMLETLGNQVAAQSAHIMELEKAKPSEYYFELACFEYRQKLAEQSAVIAYLKDFIFDYVDVEPNNELMLAKYYKATKDCDSTQVLHEWLDEKLGTPFTYVYRYHSPFGGDETELSFTRCTNEAIESIPLFKKPELSK